MEKAEKIHGKDIGAFFEQLKDDRTLVKIQLIGKDYEQLTMITDVRTKGDPPSFLIDPPSGFRQAVDELDVWRINFECTARDGVQYRFQTSGEKVSGKELWINFPIVVERMQRRRDFRLEFPQGTVICFEEGNIKYELKVTNLSMGGTLAEFPIPKIGVQEIPMLTSGETLRDIELISPSENELRVQIKKALILRLSKNNRADQYILALQFTKMDNTAIKALKELIYNVQREFLKKRLRTNV